MLTEQEMLNTAINHIKEIQKGTNLDLVIIEESIIIKSYGSIFFYTNKKYYETQEIKYAIAGNAPFLVEKKTGNIITFGTAYDEEFYIREYEKSIDLKNTEK